MGIDRKTRAFNILYAGEPVNWSEALRTIDNEIKRAIEDINNRTEKGGLRAAIQFSSPMVIDATNEALERDIKSWERNFNLKTLFPELDMDEE